MEEILLRIAAGIIITLLVWLSERLAKLISTKIKNDKAQHYLQTASNVVFDAVKAVYQEFVESLKKSGTFDKEAQEKALYMAKEKIYQELAGPTQNFIEEYAGNFETWLDTAIHAALYNLKNR